MYPDGVLLWVVLGVIFIWLLGLSYLVWENNHFLNKLFPRDGKGFKDRLNEVLKEIEDWEDFKKRSVGYTQKVVLKRYNPYHDTGGDQSFSVAFLDGKGDGVVVTSLHSRAGTRVFAKAVGKGQEDKTQFSQEEKEVVQQAMVMQLNKG